MGLNINIDEIRYNPTKIQSAILNAIEVGNNGTITLTDPTNPFIMLMEANVSLTNDALQESIVNLRRTYPSLAVKPDDLYHHLSDIEAVNMYGVPAEATMLFTINMKDFLENGYDSDGKISMIIPEFSTVVVSNTTFTILNDIKISYFKDSEKINVEQLISSNEISIKDIGVLRSTIIVDENNNSWLRFETLVKQTKRFVVEDTIITGMGFKKELIINDQYYVSNVFVKNVTTGNQWRKINISHSDIVFDPMIPTIHIKVIDNKVLYNVPEIYLLNNTISGSIRIELYDTKGQIRLNIHKIDISEFNLTLGDVGKNEMTAVSENIMTLASSRVILDGGRNQRTMEELRTTIIENTTGINTLPITRNEIDEKASYNGFKISSVLDIITDRYFIANKPIADPLDNNVKVKMDLFLNRIGLIASEHVTNKFINIVDDEKLVIRSGTVFVNKNNIVTPLDNTEYINLRNLTNELLTNTLADTKYFYTPFYYIMDTVNGIVNCKTYDLDIPELNNVRIMSKNVGDISANVEKFTAYTTATGFTLVFTSVGNSAYNDIDPTYIRAQLGIKLPNTEDRIYFYTTMDPVTRYLKFKIDTNFYIDDKEHMSIINGFSNLNNKRIELNSEISIILYTVDPNIIRNPYTVTDEIIFDTDVNIMALSKEHLDLSLGKELKYLWNNISTDYTERKYKKYLDDIPLYYTEDIYDVDENGNTFEIITDPVTGEETINYFIIHKVGDPMLDNDGNQLYKHRIGDVIHDDLGNPIIDLYSGIIRYLDVFMLEYEFELDLTTYYSDYKNNVMNLIRLYIDKNMEDLNSRMLDNTAIFYSPDRSNKSTEITVGLNKYLIHNVIKPTVTLYVLDSSPLVNDDINNIRGTIGIIIHRHLDTGEINLNNIKEDIITTFGNTVKGVSINNIDGGIGLELFKITSSSSKLTIGKKVSYDVKKDIFIEYMIDIEIHKM
jgi:hypothetical protein